MTSIGSLRVGILVLLAVAATLRATAQGDVVADHIRAIGGQEALSKIKTVKRSGSLELGGIVGQLEGEFMIAFVIGKKAYTSMDLGIAVDVSAWNGTIGWKRDTELGLREISGDDLEELQLQAEIDLIASITQDSGAAAFTQGEDEMLGDVKCHTLEIIGESSTLYIDAESKMLAAVKTSIEVPQLGAVELIISYSDYAEFQGVKLPGRMKIDVGDGMLTVDCRYEKTEINGKLDESIFEMPED